MRVCTVIALSAGLWASGAMAGPPPREVVLHPGETIEARNKFGTVQVTYVSPLKRKYQWDGKTRVVKMIARPDRFLGELGLYEPAGCWIIACPNPRLVVREAFHDFPNDEELYRFLYQGSGVMDWVYTDDGLVVGFGRSQERQQINVDVRQLTVRGQKPVGLRGARNEDIRLISDR